MNRNKMNNQNNAQNQNSQNNAQNQNNPNNAKNSKGSKNSRTSGGVSKLPAGTPSSAKDGAGYSARTTTDPAVPNRAHTEI